MEQTYFRKGFGLKGEIQGALTDDYHSAVVDEVRSRGHTLTLGDLTVRLAQEFGFCYGVDRAVEYAYETRAKFPGKRIFLVGEIIHNPHVNAKLAGMGIVIIARSAAGEFDFAPVSADDVVILPAFGVTREDFERLRTLGSILVDTTCGSVLNVWKRVESYARDGFTAIIHGKYQHEETRATASQVTDQPGGRYLVVRDMAEARLVCDFIERGDASGAETLRARFGAAASPGFDPAHDLERIGIANQTTMLSTESLAIAAELRRAMTSRHGVGKLGEHFRSFDTICSATQDRQDAVLRLLQDSVDVMVVIGGYNSSNTNHLAALCAERLPTYHIEDASCIDAASGTIRHKPVGGHQEAEIGGWLGAGGERRIVGVTAGASTPNNKVGETIERIFATRGIALGEALA
ncbi:MAG TPA: 4-hydroxy-3-methylbut-2-enyl diphosphate reductase [Gemmatimonadales bacterium]|nr:4-hydroxy-3-methylbut-2-enyl diphosphate reductase [Gemmatimonadales bacterium]